MNCDSFFVSFVSFVHFVVEEMKNKGAGQRLMTLLSFPFLTTKCTKDTKREC